jgi:hypothetical protein
MQPHTLRYGRSSGIQFSTCPSCTDYDGYTEINFLLSKSSNWINCQAIFIFAPDNHSERNKLKQHHFKFNIDSNRILYSYFTFKTKLYMHYIDIITCNGKHPNTGVPKLAYKLCTYYLIENV